MDYGFLREFADSWGLLYLVVLFIGIVIYVFRPGTKKMYQQNSQIPLKRD